MIPLETYLKESLAVGLEAGGYRMPFLLALVNVSITFQVRSSLIFGRITIT